MFFIQIPQNHLSSPLRQFSADGDQIKTILSWFWSNVVKDLFELAKQFVCMIIASTLSLTV